MDAARSWFEQSDEGEGASNLVRQAISDYLANRYFGAAAALSQVHAQRRSFYDDQRSVKEATGVEDDADDLTVDFASRNATHPEKGRLLFHLARVFAPGNAIELGTSIGISAAYFRIGLSAGGGGSLVTIDHSASRAALAAQNWRDLNLEGITSLVGRFDDVLPTVLNETTELRLAYIDGNHRLAPTMKYFELFKSRMSSGLVVFDDIRWSDEMAEAWSAVTSQHPGTIDLGWIGLAVVDH